MNLPNNIKSKIIQATKTDLADCGKVCFDFAILYTPYDLGYLFMRYIRVDASIPEKPKQVYRWICFDLTGKRLDCDPIFNSVEGESAYKKSMRTLYQTKHLTHD